MIPPVPMFLDSFTGQPHIPRRGMLVRKIGRLFHNALSAGVMLQCQIEVRNQQLARVVIFRCDTKCAEVRSDHTCPSLPSADASKSSAARTTSNSGC